MLLSEDFLKRQNKTVYDKGDNITSLSKIYKLRHVEIASAKELVELPAENELFSIVTFKSFSAFDFVLMIVDKYETIDRLFVATFNISQLVANHIVNLIKNNQILQFDLVANKKFRIAKSDRKKFEDIETLSKQNERVKIHFLSNHAKFLLVQINKLYFIWAGSGNSSQNAEIEFYNLWQSQEMFYNIIDFYDKQK